MIQKSSSIDGELENSFNPRFLMKVHAIDDLSVRAANSLRNENIVYIGELVQKTEAEMLKIPNFGRKSLGEMREKLSKIGLKFGMEIPNWPSRNNIEDFLRHYMNSSKDHEKSFATPARQDNITEIAVRNLPHKENPNLDEKLRNLDFNPDLLRKTEQFGLSARAAGCLRRDNIIYVGDLVRMTEAEMLRTPNFGRTSLNEIKEKLNKIGLRFGMDLYGWPPQNTSQKHIEELSQIYEHSLADQNTESLLDLIQKRLVPREYDVISRRFALDSKSSQTLEEISKDYNCTRERIRQIETKALRKMKVPLKRACEKYLDSQIQETEAVLFDSAGFIKYEDVRRLFKQLDGLLYLAIDVRYGSREQYLNKKHVKYKNYWICSSLDEEKKQSIKNVIDSGSPEEPIGIRIFETLRRWSWPVEIDQLVSSIPEYSGEVVRNVLVDKFKIQVHSGKIVQITGGLRAPQRLALIFRRFGRPMRPCEIRPMHSEMFGFDMNEHAISAVLSRFEEALIVDRGVYNIYENLGLDAADLGNIRQSSFDLLNDRQVYLSAGVIYRSLYLGKHTYGSAFNKYMLYGILQDDARFMCKRGLMLGLKNFPDDAFTSLMERVQEVVDAHGPIKIKDIQDQLASERHVLDVTIGMMLDSNDSCIKVGPSEYDKIERVIGDEAHHNLTLALQIALIEGAQTTHSLRKRLESVGIRIADYPLCSFVDKLDNTQRDRDMVELLQPEPSIVEYNRIFRISYSGDSNIENIKRNIYQSLKTEDHFLVKLDYRLTKPSNEYSTSQAPDELDKMMNDFRL